MKTNTTQQADPQAEAGQAVYNKGTLSAYDFFVLGFSNRLLWKCPTAKLLAHYNRHVSANHLDVGVGTGYFLDHCQFPHSTPRIALMDMNASSLSYAAQRIARYRPQTFTQNILQPVTHALEPFDSIGINYLLHCLPGTLNLLAEHSKSVIFKHLRKLMKPGAVLFGSTLLQGSAPRSKAAQQLMNLYNQKGVFSNQTDHLEDLQAALAQYFDKISIERVGCAALFSASAQP